MSLNTANKRAPFDYSGRQAAQISFPLGGIGSGCIGLAGNGQLIDWEIFNKPNKNSFNQFTHFAIKWERGGRVLAARVLHSDLQPPYMGAPATNTYHGYGYGPAREHLSGLPHFPSSVFRGTFPFARIAFKDTRVPATVRMTAFNPFIPLNDTDSSIPAAFISFTVRNTTRTTLACTIAGILGNPLPAPNLHALRREGRARMLHLQTGGAAPGDVTHGDLCLATDASDVTAQRYWFRGGWFDALDVWWQDFSAPGKLRDRGYDAASAGNNNHGVLAARRMIAPGETAEFRFVISWNFPICENYWHKDSRADAAKAGVPPTWKNFYATRWPDAAASAVYALANWDRLQADTERFTDALFASTLPPAVIDAVSANLSILKSPTVLRLEDGTFYGFEGCHGTSGCCPGSCTHVWNYAQALPFLFPALERSMRVADYHYNLRPDGGMPFRMSLPLGVDRSGFRPCADGQFGNVLKTYRDWKISGDTGWLRALWPAVKKSIEFAWAPTNEDRWDPDKTGVLHGRQHHTLDMELFGPNSWLTGFYLGALKAGAEMAAALGDHAAAQEFGAVFSKGKAWVEAHLFNGEYFCQRIDLGKRAILEPFATGSGALGGSGIFDAYWDAEHRQIKYQIGEGCGIDQVVAQWHADLYGLGEVFDAKKTVKALRAVFRHNFKKPMRDTYNPCRIYCLNDEAGLSICAWPRGRRTPVIPVPYALETMHGFEYAAAGHMIMRGLVREGLAVVKSVRERYNGERRNPWNEFECGSNYARSLASYALLNAFSGFAFDATRGMIGFAPAAGVKLPFTCFWALDGAWGTVSISVNACTLRVLYGALALKELRLPWAQRAGSATLGGTSVACACAGGSVLFKRISITPIAALTVRARRRAKV